MKKVSLCIAILTTITTATIKCSLKKTIPGALKTQIKAFSQKTGSSNYPYVSPWLVAAQKAQQNGHHEYARTLLARGYEAEKRRLAAEGVKIAQELAAIEKDSNKTPRK